LLFSLRNIWIIAVKKIATITKKEFRSQEPEFSMNSMPLVDELWFKVPRFIRGDKEKNSLLKPLTPNS